MSWIEVEPDLVAYANYWHEGKFFEAHEALEPRWIRVRDSGLQGLIQLAAALHHIQKDNLRGARRMLDRAFLRLRDPANAPCRIDLKMMAAYTEALRANVDSPTLGEIVAARPAIKFH